LDGSAADHQKRLAAGRTKAPSADGTVLIIGDGRRPVDQQRFASQTPGAVTVEAVDLRDLVTFAQSLNMQAAHAVSSILDFAKSLMTEVNGPDLLRRLDCLRRGTARNAPSEVEAAALAFEADRCHRKVADLLVEINRQSGVRVFRPAVFRACMQALQHCESGEDFAEAAVRMREQYRLLGRSLPRRAVGSTLLLKGLEADVAVILSADELDARNLYVALTRGSQQLVVCARNPLLG
jgi:DNA helicase-2/ATP-dependent DNA helicase PcrA